MDHVEKAYHELTGVDIEQQRILWDERGRGYYGEYLVFREIYPNVSGNCKILMNLQIPTPNGRTTEIDLLLIHETGLYVFEVKHYKGTIYGDPNRSHWVQYFRTAPNQTFRNPVEQNQYHIHALDSMYPNIPTHSCVVFTNPDCVLKAECFDPNLTVCKLSDLNCFLTNLQEKPAVMDRGKIDNVFFQLLPYAPIMHYTVKVPDKELFLYEYVNFFASDYQNQVQKKEKAARTKTAVAITTSIIACAVCVALCIITCIGYKKHSTEQINAAQTELQTFAQKFEKVGPYNNGDITMEKGFITASEVQLSKSVDVKNATNLHFTLDWNGEYYGLNVSRNATIIVQLKDGSVKEYDLLESTFPYPSSDLRLGPDSSWYSSYDSYEFPVHELADVYIGDITFIKLSGLDVWVMENNKPTLIGTGYEVKIYG